MDDTASRERALEVARLIDDHKGEHTVVLYIGDMTTWTDYFIITTVRSSAHMAGLTRELHRYFKERAIQPLNRHRRLSEKGWILIDCGRFIVHLMEKEQRDFYELERLWFRGEPLPHSSKSS